MSRKTVATPSARNEATITAAKIRNTSAATQMAKLTMWKSVHAPSGDRRKLWSQMSRITVPRKN